MVLKQQSSHERATREAISEASFRDFGSPKIISWGFKKVEQKNGFLLGRYFVISGWFLF